MPELEEMAESIARHRVNWSFLCACGGQLEDVTPEALSKHVAEGLVADGFGKLPVVAGQLPVSEGLPRNQPVIEMGSEWVEKKPRNQYVRRIKVVEFGPTLMSAQDGVTDVTDVYFAEAEDGGWEARRRPISSYILRKNWKVA